MKQEENRQTTIETSVIDNRYNRCEQLFVSMEFMNHERCFPLSRDHPCFMNMRSDVARCADRLTVVITFPGRFSLILGLSFAFISIYACNQDVSVWLSGPHECRFFFFFLHDFLHRIRRDGTYHLIFCCYFHSLLDKFRSFAFERISSLLFSLSYVIVISQHHMFFHTVFSYSLSLSLDSHVGHQTREYTVYAGLHLI